MDATKMQTILGTMAAGLPEARGTPLGGKRFCHSERLVYRPTFGIQQLGLE